MRTPDVHPEQQAVTHARRLRGKPSMEERASFPYGSGPDMLCLSHAHHMTPNALDIYSSLVFLRPVGIFDTSPVCLCSSGFTCYGYEGHVRTPDDVHHMQLAVRHARRLRGKLPMENRATVFT
jgi:hypothetical protein